MKPEKTQHILSAASRLISHYGFDKTTMDDIAREAGVSKGALYLAWSSKDELLDALIQFEMKRLLLDFQHRMDQDPQGGQIASIYKHALLALKNNPLVCALYTHDNQVMGDFVKRQDSSRYTQRVLFSADLVRQMQTADLLRRDLQPEVIAYLFSIIAVGFIYIGTIIPEANQPALDEITGALTDVIRRGLAGPGDDSSTGKQAMHQMSQYMLQQYNQEEKR